MRMVRRFEPLVSSSVAFLFQMTSLWLLAVPAPWVVPLVGMALGGFLHVARQRTDAGARDAPDPTRCPNAGDRGVRRLQCIGAPIGLVLAGFALARYDTHSVLTVVLGLQSVAIIAFVASALAERSALRAAAVDSPATELASP